MTTRIGILKEKEKHLISEFIKVVQYIDHMQGYQGVLSDIAFRKKQEIEDQLEENREKIRRLQNLG